MKTLSTIASMAVLSLFVAACNRPSQVEERNRAIIEKANEELLGKWNAAYADEVFAVDYTNAAFSEKGPSTIKSYLEYLKQAFPDLTYKVEISAAEGNIVTWKRTHTGTHKGDFFGYKASGKPVSWTVMAVTRFGEDGKIVEESGISDFAAAVSQASGIEGMFEYVAPMKGQAVIRNGRFVFAFAQANGQHVGQSGTYAMSGDVITNTINFSNNPKEVGTSFNWKVKSWSGDTLTFNVINEKGESQFDGRAVRVSQ